MEPQPQTQIQMGPPPPPQMQLEPPPQQQPGPPLMGTELSNSQKLERLRAEVPGLKDISVLDRDGFLSLATRYLSGEERIKRDVIHDLDEVVIPYDSIGEVKHNTGDIDRLVFPEDIKKPTNEDLRIKAMLDRLVVVKLNGEIQNMSSTCPRALSELPDGSIALDHFVAEIETLNITYRCNIPLLIMNTFRTEEDTLKVISRYENSNVKIFLFDQGKKFEFCMEISESISRDTLDNVNLWANLDSIKYLVEKDSLKPDAIPYYKDVGGSRIIQLETHAGAARKFFNRAVVLSVPRSRLYPPKQDDQSPISSRVLGSLVAWFETACASVGSCVEWMKHKGANLIDRLRGFHLTGLLRVDALRGLSLVALLRLNQLSDLFLFYVAYHLLLFVGYGFILSRVEDEVYSTWYEGLFWFGTVLCYGFLVRIPVEVPVVDNDRRRDSEVYHMIAQAFGRLIYFGLEKTFQKKMENPWTALAIAHSSAAFVEILCSFVIECWCNTGVAVDPPM